MTMLWRRRRRRRKQLFASWIAYVTWDLPLRCCKSRFNVSSIAGVLALNKFRHFHIVAKRRWSMAPRCFDKNANGRLVEFVHVDNNAQKTPQNCTNRVAKRPARCLTVKCVDNRRLKDFLQPWTKCLQSDTSCWQRLSAGVSFMVRTIPVCVKFKICLNKPVITMIDKQ